MAYEDFLALIKKRRSIRSFKTDPVPDEHVDRIIYIEKGKKIAEGSKETLLKICPEFRRMWENYHRYHKLQSIS